MPTFASCASTLDNPLTTGFLVISEPPSIGRIIIRALSVPAGDTLSGDRNTWLVLGGWGFLGMNCAFCLGELRGCPRGLVSVASYSGLIDSVALFQEGSRGPSPAAC